MVSIVDDYPAIRGRMFGDDAFVPKAKAIAPRIEIRPACLMCKDVGWLQIFFNPPSFQVCCYCWNPSGNKSP